MRTEGRFAPLLTSQRLRDLPDARRRMVEVLRRMGIRGDVLGAMAVVPRHAYAPRRLAAEAYGLRALCVGPTALTHPFYVAFMTQQLQLGDRTRVLEIGTGTGYQTTILALLAGGVFTVERNPALVKESAARFAAAGLDNVRQRQGDGHMGWGEAAPFDAIIVAAAPLTIPDRLVRQLHPEHGRMILPVGPARGSQELYLVRRRRGVPRITRLGIAQFMPLVAASSRVASAGPRCVESRRPSAACSRSS